VADGHDPASQKPRQWTARQLRDMHSMVHFIGHIERDAAALGLRDIAKIIAVAASMLGDEIAEVKTTQHTTLTLVKS
jgi:hypothetical protein